jgi:hypothetical protein
VLIIKKILTLGLLVLLLVSVCYAAGDYYYDIAVEETADTYFDGIRFDDVKVYVNGDKESRVDEEGGKIDASPDNEVLVQYKVESMFDSQSTIEMKDVDVYVVIYKLYAKSKDDFEEHRDNPFDLEAGEKESDDLKFKVPVEIREGRYDMEIRAKGYDDKDNLREGYVKFRLDIDKERNELKLDRKSVSSSGYCEGLAYIVIELVNTGSSKQRLDLDIENYELGIHFDENIELDDDPVHEDNKYYKTFKIEQPKLDVIQGSYPVNIRIESEYSLIEETVTLTVPNCGEYGQDSEALDVIKARLEEQKKSGEYVAPVAVEPSVEVVYSENPVVTASGFPQKTTTKEVQKDNFLKKNPKLVLFIILDIGLLLGLIIAVQAVIKKRKKKA